MLLYLHIPYCDSKCHYCSFNSYVDRFDTRPAYMEALYRQLHFELTRFHVSTGAIKTLFIGGGTPSTVSPALYAPIFELIRPYLCKDAEITAEANPNSATRQWLSGMHALGVNRISFGVQSFNRDKLKALGRAHSPKQAVEAIHSAAELGYTHLSLDLIYNYRNDTETLMREDIAQAFSLPIDHLSAYELTIESGTPFAADPSARQENETLALFIAREITERGFTHYEISNYGRYQSRHNMGYWQLQDYIGAGAGAVGFRKKRRYYPTTDIDTYIRHPLQISEEPLSHEALLTERLFLGLRSCVGVAQSLLTPSMIQRAELLIQEGKLSISKGRLYNNNYFLADEIALFLME